MQARSNSLSDIDGARNHGAIDWRHNLGALEINLGLFQGSFALSNDGLGAFDLGAGDFNIGTGDFGIALGVINGDRRRKTLFLQSLLANVAALGLHQDRFAALQCRFLIGERGFGGGEIGLGLRHLG